MRLGGVEVGWRTLHHYAHQIQTWQSIQTIYIYGCNVAIGDAGSEFLETLHTLTGATVYASSTPIGNQQLGGNWQLDTVYGAETPIDSADLAFSETTQATYRYTFETYTVTTLADENDGGDGGKKLSLREAIALANANPGNDTIVFQSSKKGTIVLEKGVLEITDPIEIKGPGADKLTISGNDKSSIFKIAEEPTEILQFNPYYDRPVTIEGFTLTRGGNRSELSTSGEDGDIGAAIVNFGYLTLKDSVISGNTAGIIRERNVAYPNDAGVYLINSEISNNDREAIATGGVIIRNSNIVQNGGIAISAVRYFAGISIINSTVSDNGGGIYELGSGRDARTTIEDSVITNNSGGINSTTPYGGQISVIRSIISGNTGGLRADSSSVRPDEACYYSAGYCRNVTIVDSQVTHNGEGVQTGIAEITRSNVSNNDDGVSANIRLKVLDSVISGNNGIGLSSTGASEYSYGYGITGYYTSIVNSTVSGNAKDGIRVSKGPDVDATNPTIISNSTVTNNGREGGSGVVWDTQFPDLENPIKINNSIVSGNFNNSDVEGSFESQGNNLIGNDDGATGLLDGVNGDQVGTAANPIDAKLGPLQDNGGPTETHALLPDSPAIDAGKNALIPVDVTTDQRGAGFDRIFNGVVDIGAFEVQSGGTTPLPGADIVGTGRKDVLQGTELGERIDGEKGNDRIDGKAGNDVIVGGIGQDDLTGGSDSDTFVYETFKDRNDTIRDFEAGIDTIDLSLLFIEPKFSSFDDSAGRFDNYVRLRQRSQGVSVEVNQLGDNGTNFVRMALLRDVELVDLSINDFQLV